MGGESGPKVTSTTPKTRCSALSHRKKDYHIRRKKKKRKREGGEEVGEEGGREGGGGGGGGEGGMRHTL